MRCGTGALHVSRRLLTPLLVVKNLRRGLANLRFETRPQFNLAAAVVHLVATRLTCGLVTLAEYLLELCIRHRVVHQDLPSWLVGNRLHVRGGGRGRSAARLSGHIRFAAGRGIRGCRPHRARASRCHSRGLRNRLRRGRRSRLRRRLIRFTHNRISSRYTRDHHSADYRQQASDRIHATPLVLD